MNIKNLVIITFILLLFNISPSLADDSIINFQIEVPIPDTIIASSTYQTEYSFTSTRETNIEINFNISHSDIKYNDWTVCFILNDTVIATNENYQGCFSSSIINIPQDEYTLIISFRSLPNIKPDEYTFTTKLYSENEIVEIVKKKSSGNGGDWPIITPTPTITPTPISTSSPSTATLEPTPTPTSTPIFNETNVTIQPTPEKPSLTHWIILLVTILMIITGILIYRNRRKE